MDEIRPFFQFTFRGKFAIMCTRESNIVYAAESILKKCVLRSKGAVATKSS